MNPTHYGKYESKISLRRAIKILKQTSQEINKIFWLCPEVKSNKSIGESDPTLLRTKKTQR